MSQISQNNKLLHIRSNILAIDDDPLVRKYVESVLKPIVSNVFLSENGLQGIEMLEKMFDDIDVVIVDLMMPVMDGFEFVKHVRKRFPGQKPYIIVLTSKGEEDTIAQCFELGANDFLTKPISGKLLQIYVKKALSIANSIDPGLLLEIPLRLLGTRDKYTLFHSENVKMYTSVLTKILLTKSEEGEFSQELPISSQKNIIELETAALVHDVGKIAVPDFIWQKPGRFTPEERNLMKLHTTYGAVALERLLNKYRNHLLKLCYEATRWHHERWDGKGYPDGLKEREIPITARIIAIADVFDALTTKRIYRDEYTPEEAIEIMKNEEVGHFDPEIFQIFLEHERLFASIAKSRLTSQLKEIEQTN
ncbi:HD domain-containing phosphohydrolase [Fervidobacterium sp.]